MANSKAKEKATETFKIPILVIPRTASQNARVFSTSSDNENIAVVRAPLDKVTCLTSRSIAKNCKTTGNNPSRNPKEILEAMPKIFRLINKENVFARKAPNTNIRRRLAERAKEIR